MRLNRATHLAWMLLFWMGSSVSIFGAQTSNVPKKKPTTPKSSAANKSSASSAAAHRTKTGKRSTRKGSASSKSRVRGQMVPTPQRITEIQQALAKDGSFAGTPSGKWDDSTVAAMKHFQQAHGLNPTGKLDALTLQKLGLGSQTAGVAPPTVSSSSLLMKSSPPDVTANRE